MRASGAYFEGIGWARGDLLVNVAALAYLELVVSREDLPSYLPDGAGLPRDRIGSGLGVALPGSCGAAVVCGNVVSSDSAVPWCVTREPRLQPQWIVGRGGPQLDNGQVLPALKIRPFQGNLPTRVEPTCRRGRPASPPDEPAERTPAGERSWSPSTGAPSP